MGIAPDLVAQRQQQVREAAREFRRRRGAGERLDESQFIAQHPKLMPELAIELARQRGPAGFDTHTAVDQPLPVSNSPVAERAAPPRLQAEARPELPGPPAIPAAGSEASLVLHREVEGGSNLAPHLTVPGYTLTREIHRGGQGVVFEARQESTGQRVAVKVLRQGPLASPQELARFDREAQVLAGLRHPNIVTVLDRGRTREGSFFLVMEFVSGNSLDEWLAGYFRDHPSGPPASDPSELLRLFMRIANAVNAAHLRGVVHRDIKPSNIHIDQFGEPHILDFGLAHVFSAGGSAAAPVTITGQFLGSLPWASPEQAEGVPANIDFRTDVYSLGVILYQMLTGQFPYDVMGNMRDVLDNIMRAEPSPPSTIIAAKLAKQAQSRRRPKAHAAINSAIDSIVLKALAKRREERYQTAGELGRDIGNYLAGRPTLAGGVAPEPVARWRTALAWTAGLVAVAVVSGLAALGLDRAWQRPSPVAESALREPKNDSVSQNSALEKPAALENPANSGNQIGEPANRERIEPLFPAVEVAGAGAATTDPGPAGGAGAAGSSAAVPSAPATLSEFEGPLANAGQAGEPSIEGSHPAVPSGSNAPPPDGSTSSSAGLAASPMPDAEPIVLRSWRIALRLSPTALAEATELASVAWSPDGRQIAVAGRKMGRPVLGFYEASLNAPCKWFQQDAMLRGLRWSAPRRAVIGVTGGQDAMVWSARPTSVLQLAGSYHPSSLATCAAWSPDGTRIAVASSDGYVSFYDAPGGRIRNRTWLLERAVPIQAIDYSADGRLIAVAVANEPEVILLDGNGGHVGRLPAPGGNVLALSFGPGDAHLAVAHGSASERVAGMVEVWDVPGQKSLGQFSTPGPAYAVAWSPLGGQLAVAVSENDYLPGTLGLYQLGASVPAWRVAKGVAPRLLAGYPVSWSPDGQLVAAVAGDQKVTAYDSQTGKPRLVLVSDDHSLSLAVSPNGHFRGPPAAEELLVYIATTSDGQEHLLPPAEFFSRFAVTNNPESVSLLPER